MPGPFLGLAPSGVLDNRAPLPRTPPGLRPVPGCRGGGGEAPDLPAASGCHVRGGDPAGKRLKAERSRRGPLRGGSSWGRLAPPQSSGGTGSGGCLKRRGVPGMSGVWGTGGPRCQAALALLASLCRARPPPLGLDVETCRSFELQPPERSPSAADSGNGKSEDPSPPGFSPWRSCLLEPRPREPRNLGRELQLRILDSKPAVASALLHCPQGKRRNLKGDLGGRDSPSPLPCDSSAVSRKAALPGCGAPRGPQFP